MLKTLPMFACALALAACGGGGEDEAPEEGKMEQPEPIPSDGPLPSPSPLDCPKGTYLTFENFGESFALSYCTSCHSQGVAEGQRGGAPVDINFDAVKDMQIWRLAISTTVLGENPTMPPAGNVTATDQALLKEWLNCGAPSGGGKGRFTP